MYENVVLFSGGIDSTTALAMAIAGSTGLTLALSIRYGSLHEDAEMRAARRIVVHYNVAHRVITLPPGIYDQSDSALFDSARISDGDYKQEGPQPTVVPFRNGLMISIATALAASIGAKYVWIANHASDYARWAYPDCSPEFVGSMASAVHIASLGVRLRYPFLWMCKGEVVEIAYGLVAPLHFTWSCYKGGFIHCGVCSTCRERKQAFKDADAPDPTEYVNDTD